MALLKVKDKEYDASCLKIQTGSLFPTPFFSINYIKTISDSSYSLAYDTISINNT